MATNAILANIKLSIACAIISLLIFTIDLQISLGVAGGVPYIFVILISLWSTKPHFVIYLAILCSILTILGFYFSPPGGELWKVMFNRSLALFAIWVTAILALKWRLYQQEMYLLKERIEKEKIYIATMQGAQHIINNLINSLQLVELEINKHPDFDNKTSSQLSDILNEAKSLMNDLSTVDRIDSEAIRQSVYPKDNA